MGDLHEIVDIQAIGHLFVWLAVFGPIGGAVAGAIAGSRGGDLKPGAFKGLLFGFIGPLNLLLWRIYNAITDRNGLDSVRNLVINLLLFVLVGLIIGTGVALLSGRSGKQAAVMTDRNISSDSHANS